MIFGGVLDVTYGKYIVLHVICKCPNKDFIVDVLWLYAIMLPFRNMTTDLGCVICWNFIIVVYSWNDYF